MADLMPSLSSDDDETKKGSREDDESGDEIDRSFQFGGILGEDGGLASFQEIKGWSYQTALDQVERDTSDSVPRMDVKLLIAAKRKSFQTNNVQKQNQLLLHQKQDNNENDDNQSSQPRDDEDYSCNKEENGTDDDSCDTGSDEGKDDTAKELGEDILKTRAEIGENGEKVESHNDDTSEGEDSRSDEDKEELAKAKAFFDNDPLGGDQQNTIEAFAQLALSRPLLRGIATMGFVKPTPIQAAVIPLALQGRDICASAVTGSGKTAAFLLPILERLLHRNMGRTKAIVLTPTRELAAQCVGMMTTFAKFTKLRATLIVGGTKNVNSQAAELRTNPEIIVATPGRLLDHVTNSMGVSLGDVEFLVLDEADRLLDLGFQNEVHELVKACPVQRQTMLFSATMNTKVDDLVKLSLKRPVRVRITDRKDTSRDIEVAPRLEQEFIRVRPANEGLQREAMLLALLSRTFTKQTIVFFDMKSTAHRLMILCGLVGIKCAELHGNLTQQQRLTALEDFRTGAVDILLATDLAARGLDIDRVECVINFEMPSQMETYIHRIGRTARAGRGGCSCTLIGEGRRHLMKELIKDAKFKLHRNKNGSKSNRFESGIIRSRTIPPAVIMHFVGKIESLESHMDDVLQAEAVAKMDRLAEMEVTRAKNIIEHSSEIQSRPKKEWFASKKQKEDSKLAAAEKKKLIEEKVGTGMHRMTRKKRRAREALEAMNAASTEGGERDDGEDADSAQPKKTLVNVKLAARAQKRQKEMEKQEKYGLSVKDVDIAKIEKQRKKKGVIGKNAAGDGSLFDEERVSYMTKNQSQVKKEGEMAQSSYQFRGYDPDKKLGKKKGRKAFKSKAKYKRR